MMKHRTSEEWLAEVDAVIRRYRSGHSERVGYTRLTQEEAVAELRRLGLTYGEAVRWLTTRKDR